MTYRWMLVCTVLGFLAFARLFWYVAEHEPIDIPPGLEQALKITDLPEVRKAKDANPR